MQRLSIEPGSPWENGYNESFNGKLRNEFLNGDPCKPIDVPPGTGGQATGDQRLR